MSDHRKRPRDFSQAATLDLKSVPIGGRVLADFELSSDRIPMFSI
jgi:hypothetical protein